MPKPQFWNLATRWVITALSEALDGEDLALSVVRLRHITGLSDAAIRRSLKKLEGAGYLIGEVVPTEFGRPPKVYSLTEDGVHAFADLRLSDAREAGEAMLAKSESA